MLTLACISAIALSSCKKCVDCVCVNQTSYEFDPNISAQNQTTIENAYDQSFEDTYPEDASELCETRGKKFKEALADYEAESTTITENNTISGNDWSFTGTHTCTCED